MPDITSKGWSDFLASILTVSLYCKDGLNRKHRTLYYLIIDTRTIEFKQKKKKRKGSKRAV